MNNHKKNLNEEINRYREIMGLKLIVESPIPKILNLLGIQTGTLKVSDDISSYSKKLADANVKTGEQLKQYVADRSPGKSFDTITDEAIVDFINSDEVIKKQILLNSEDKILSNATKEFIKTIDINKLIGKENADAINRWLNFPLDGLNSFNTNKLNGYIVKLENKFKELGINDDRTKKIIESLKSKVTMAEEARNLISKSTTTSVDNIAGNAVDKVLYDIKTKINSGEGFTPEQEKAIKEFKTEFGENAILNTDNKQLLVNRLEALKNLASEGNVDAVKTISKLRKIANEIGGVIKDTVDGIFDSTGKAALIMGKIPAKGWIGMSIAAVLVMGTVGVYGFKEEFSSGVYTKGTKLYCWTNNVSTFTELDLNERKFLSDATGITCEDFDGDDLSRIPVLVKKFISKNTQKPYYVVKFKDETTIKYDENFKISKPKSIDEFKNFIIKSWGGDIRGDETYNQNGDLYIVNDGIDDYTYKYENGKFIYQKEY